MKTPPVFGQDYDVGWVGFTYYPNDFTSEAIAYGERWERPVGHAPVSHAFMCTGVDQGIEAHLETGVAQFCLAKYYHDTNCNLYFRRPRGWNAALGVTLAALMRQTPPFGRPYDKRLILVDAIEDSIWGHRLNQLSRGVFGNLLLRLLDDPRAFVCSEAVAFAMQKRKELTNLGCLKRSANQIDPQMLFDDEEVFEC